MGSWGRQLAPSVVNFLAHISPSVCQHSLRTIARSNYFIRSCGFVSLNEHVGRVEMRFKLAKVSEKLSTLM